MIIIKMRNTNTSTIIHHHRHRITSSCLCSSPSSTTRRRRRRRRQRLQQPCPPPPPPLLTTTTTTTGRRRMILLPQQLMLLLFIWMTVTVTMTMTTIRTTSTVAVAVAVAAAAAVQPTTTTSSSTTKPSDNILATSTTADTSSSSRTDRTTDETISISSSSISSSTVQLIDRLLDEDEEENGNEKIENGEDNEEEEGIESSTKQRSATDQNKKQQQQQGQQQQQQPKQVSSEEENDYNDYNDDDDNNAASSTDTVNYFGSDRRSGSKSESESDNGDESNDRIINEKQDKEEDEERSSSETKKQQQHPPDDKNNNDDDRGGGDGDDDDDDDDYDDDDNGDDRNGHLTKKSQRRNDETRQDVENIGQDIQDQNQEEATSKEKLDDSQQLQSPPLLPPSVLPTTGPPENADNDGDDEQNDDRNGITTSSGHHHHQQQQQPSPLRRTTTDKDDEESSSGSRSRKAGGGGGGGAGDIGDKQQQYAYDEYPVDDTAVELDLEDDAYTASTTGRTVEEETTAKKNKKMTEQKDDGKKSNDSDLSSSSSSSTTSDDDGNSDDNKVIVPDENDGDAIELASKEVDKSNDDNDGTTKTKHDDDEQSHETTTPTESTEDTSLDDETKHGVVKDGEGSSHNETAAIANDNGGENTDESNAEGGDEDDEPIASQFSVDYASKSAGALIIDKSHDFKGTSNLLNGDKDKYAITPCQERKKFVVLSLSEDILVKQIKLANYERFASSMKNVQVMGTQTLGTRTWFDLGNYTARPGLGEQEFAVEKPAWARYLKFKFKTHHGMEYYCTLSQIKVHGSTMVQGFHEQWEQIEEENQEEESTEASVDVTKVQNEMKDATGDLSKNETSAGGVNIAESKNEPPSNLTAELSPEESAGASKDPSDAHHGKRPTQEDMEATAILDAFASSSALFEVLQGRCVNEDLYPDMYQHLPTTLESVPRSMVRSTSDKATAMNGKNDSQYYTIRTRQLHSLTTQEEGDKDSSMIALGNTESISSPKMSEFSSSLGEKVSPPSTFRFNFTWDIRARLAHLWNSTIGDKSNDDSQGQIPDPTQENGDKKIDVPSNAQPGTKDENLPDSGIVIETPGDAATMDQAFIQLLRDLPSAGCLADLDFSAFKAKFSSTRKKSVFSGGPGNSVMEPIFKKLTDEIFALQTSVSVHDQFTKATVACYQRVLLDLMVEIAKTKNDSLDRITRLEEQMLESRLQRALNLISDLFVRTSNWTISKVYLTAIFAAEQYPSLEKAVGQTFSRCLEWSSRVGVPYCRQALSTVVRFTTILFDRCVTFAFGPEGLDILATPQTNEIPSPFLGSKESKIEELPNGRQSFDSSPLPPEDMTWIFPVVPILLLLLTLRIMMCFAPSYSATKMVYWSSPARIANARSPRSDPRSITPRSGRSSRSYNSSTPHSGSSMHRSNSPTKVPGTRGSDIRISSHENIPALMDDKFAAVDVKAESILSGQIQSPSRSDVVEGNQQPQQNRTPGSDQESLRHNGHLNGGGGGGGVAGGQDEPSIVVSPSVVSVDSQPQTN